MLKWSITNSKNNWGPFISNRINQISLGWELWICLILLYDVVDNQHWVDRLQLCLIPFFSGEYNMNRLEQNHKIRIFISCCSSEIFVYILHIKQIWGLKASWKSYLDKSAMVCNILYLFSNEILCIKLFIFIIMTVFTFTFSLSFASIV